MEPIVLTRAQIRRIVISAAGLARKAQFGTGPEAVYRLVDHLGFVQLDTNYVVERAHHHVMAARIPDYEPRWLAGLVEEGRLFEYFTSDAGYLPMHDFRFSLPVKHAFQTQREPPPRPVINLMKTIMDRVEREGPLSVGDFENDRQEASTGWWDWRPAKVAIEKLYLRGELMIRRSRTFQKIYDLPGNLLPPDTDLRMPGAEEYARFVVRRTLGALGVASAKEIAWRARFVKGNLVKKELLNMANTGEVIPVRVDELKGPYYMLPGYDTDVEISDAVFILSPFDVLNIFRSRLKDFFGFDYQIECFVPAPKRRYGYFSLPVLAGDTFIARMDAKADRKHKILIVHNMHFESVQIDQGTLAKFTTVLKEFVQFNQCYDIAFRKTNREDYLSAIKTGFA